jgi:hypothetical protein
MKKIFMILFAGLLVSAGLQAQEVYIKDGKVILDLTEAAGMPAGAVTDVSKTNLYANAAPSNTGAPITDNDTNGKINAKVFQKLEIAPSDLEPMTWADAFNACKNKGEGWRLPTQRELQLMWILKEALKEAFSHPDVNGSNFLSGSYGSGTEDSNFYACCVSFKDGMSVNYDKSSDSRNLRCVREVTN